MPVSFEGIRPGQCFTRDELSNLWGYEGPESIQRGIHTPRNDNKIVLFITEQKREDMIEYQDRLVGDYLIMDGEVAHGNDQRLVDSSHNQDEIYLFFRRQSREVFTYKGRFELVDCEITIDVPSRFVLRRIGNP